MMYPGSASKQLDPTLFRDPAAQYRGLPFWSWNCTVTQELIDRQLDAFETMGFGGVVIHARVGLDTEYLSEAFLRLVRYAVDRCAQKGMLCWVYDDDRYPSGAADGLVTRDWRFRQRYLLLTERLLAEPCPNRAAFENEISFGREPVGYYFASYAVTLENGCLTHYRRIHPLERTSTSDVVRHAYVMLLAPEDLFEGNTYVDVMNPEAIHRFLQITHEAYRKQIGHAFGTTVPAMFTDEPRMRTRNNAVPRQLRSPDDHQDVLLPYTEGLREQLIRDKHIDLLDVVPELIWELPEGQKSALRYHYRNAACERFVTSFLDQIADWCKANGVFLSGHVLAEDTLLSQADALGDCMRCYRKMDIPGIDVLCDLRLFAAAKQAVSVAHQYGREGVMSEQYGVTQWDCDFKTYKLQGDWQAALGITVRIPHLAWMSMAGEGKRDWPASIFYQSPWWKEFLHIENYFARLNTVLTRGRPLVEVAVIHPVESMWFSFGPASQNADGCAKRDEAFSSLVNALLLHQVDFDFISEALLPQQEAYVEADTVCVGQMRYHTIIVPAMTTIRATTLRLLEAFADAGGRLIFASEIPCMVDAEPCTRAKELARRCVCMDGTQAALCHALTENRSVHITKADGRDAMELLMQHRLDGAAQWLFLCHAYPNADGNSAPEKYTIRVTGTWQATLYDPMNGQLSPVACMHDGKHTVIHWSAYAEDSLLLKLEPHIGALLPSNATARQERYTAVCTLTTPAKVHFSEPNVLLLDYARYQLDGGALSQKQEILRLDRELRGTLGFKQRGEQMMQPWAMAKGESHALTLYYEVEAAVPLEVRLAMEQPQDCEITLNGERVAVREVGWYVDRAIRIVSLPPLIKGCNRLTLHLPFHQKTNLENAYLLGDFDVALAPAGNSRLEPRREWIGLGDLTEQGMPFYTGNTVYTFEPDIAEAGEYAVRIPHFRSPILTVAIDGRSCGYVAYAPHRASLGFLQAGRHVLTICAYGNRHNGFGALHNADAGFVWYGPEAYRTTGDAWTDGYAVRPMGILSAVQIERIER